MVKQKRAKGTREFIIEILAKHPEWNARQVYNRYLILIGDPQNAITLNAVQKCIQSLKPILTQVRKTGLDKPWSLAVLNRLHELLIFDVNADAIEYIQKVQYYVEHEFREDWSKRLKENMKQGHPEIDQSLITEEVIAKAQGEYPVLTIRQAKWVARLYRLQSNINRLYYTALLYSNYEIVSEISGTAFDTEILDQAIHNWSDFSDLIGEYETTSKFDDSLSKATARSFSHQVDDEGEE